MSEFIEFATKNWSLIVDNPLVFILMAVIFCSIGASTMSWLKSERVELLQTRLDAKDEDIERLKNDTSNLEEIPALREEVASLKFELGLLADFDYVGAYEKARNAPDLGRNEALDPIDFVSNLFDSRVFTSLHEAKAHAVLLHKPLFIIVYDANHPSKSKLKYSAGYFLEYGSTREIINNSFVIAVLANDEASVSKLIPEDDPLENSRWIVMQEDGRIIRSEGLYANPDEGLKRTREVISTVVSSVVV